MGFPQFALLLWIPISLVIAGAARSAQHAFLWIYLGGSLLLPERMHIEIPLMPPIDKHAIAGISAWLAMVLMGRGVHKKGPQVHGGRVLLFWVFISSTATWLTNRDTLVYGPLVIPGHGFKEVLWATSGVLLKVILPYTLGQSLFRTTDDLKTLLKGLATAGLMYTPLVLAEARFAPFLHQRLYGYFQHDFVQSRRGDGFRAFVFMSHGLSVAYFIAQALTSVVVLKKNDGRLLPIKPGWATAALTVALISCKSMASMMYAGVSFLLISYTAIRAQVRFAAGLS
ncbi:MAG TPA: hypothetical protein VN764_11890, partial [Polyangiaceae bacterium]|nr:hypothetical protein [Polyangiaceae bacterium]